MKSFINKLITRTNAFTFVFWIQDKENSLEYDTKLLYDFLSNCGVGSCVSPLHDQDIDEINVDTGQIEFKKWHYHVVVDYGKGKNKNVSQFFDLIDPIRNYISVVPLDRITSEEDPKLQDDIKTFNRQNKVRNMRTLLRYFKHLDNPEKHQYIDQEFRTFGGFDLENMLYSQEDNLAIVKDIINFINTKDCYIFADLVDYSLENNYEWFQVCTRNTFNTFIIQYMKSKTYRDSNRLENYLDSGN